MRSCCGNTLPADPGGGAVGRRGVGAFLWPSAGGAAMDRFGGVAMPVVLMAACAMFLLVVAGAARRS